MTVSDSLAQSFPLSSTGYVGSWNALFRLVSHRGNSWCLTTLLLEFGFLVHDPSPLLAGVLRFPVRQCRIQNAPTRPEPHLSLSSTMSAFRSLSFTEMWTKLVSSIDDCEYRLPSRQLAMVH